MTLAFQVEVEFKEAQSWGRTIRWPIARLPTREPRLVEECSQNWSER